MQSSINLNQVLQNISELSVEEQFYLSDLLRKRLIEIRRTEIANRVQEAKKTIALEMFDRVLLLT